MTLRIRWAISLVALFPPAVAIGGTGLLWRGTLPERIASHWSDLGAADGSMSAAVVLAVSIAVAAAAAIAGVVIVALPRLTPRAKRASLFWTGAVAGTAAASWLIPSWLTLQAGSAGQAVLGAWIVPMVLCVLYGAIPYAIAPRTPVADSTDGPPPLTLRASEAGAWTRTVTAKLFLYATLVIVALAAAFNVPILLSGNSGSGWFGFTILLIACIVLASFVRLRITVDWRGLRVVSLLLHLPLKRIPLNRIRRADALELRASEWGGWGYRVMPGRSALILGSGPGLVVTTTDDKQFAITLTDPEIPAGLLNALRTRDSDIASSTG